MTRRPSGGRVVRFGDVRRRRQRDDRLEFLTIAEVAERLAVKRGCGIIDVDALQQTGLNSSHRAARRR